MNVDVLVLVCELCVSGGGVSERNGVGRYGEEVSSSTRSCGLNSLSPFLLCSPLSSHGVRRSSFTVSYQRSNLAQGIRSGRGDTTQMTSAL